ncbi:MAG: hypothetical protein ACT4NL_13890 [Pseudomarimonas sp.]
MLSPPALRIRHDVAMDLLLRGDHSGFERWRQTIPAAYPGLIHPPRQVHYWPLIDHLQSLGLAVVHPNGDGYTLSRAAGVPAPHGWSWRCMPEDE